MKTEYHFLAELQYFKTENGGRKSPAKSGFRPQVRFPFSEKSTSGLQNFIDKDLVFPGETIKAEISLLSPHFFLQKLETGMSFNIQEGSKIIGIGRILDIKNEDLKACI